MINEARSESQPQDQDLEPHPSTHELAGPLEPEGLSGGEGIGPGAVGFDWRNKWLKGEEYAHILNNIELYCQVYGFERFAKKTHPEQIYSDPQNGQIYFVEGNSIGSEFGFPRVSIKKRYRWKKMNFTTHLPKKRPAVTYIVASAVKCERFFPNTKNQGPVFRMHAVMLYQNFTQSKDLSNSANEKRYVLCHIRKLDHSPPPSNNAQSPQLHEDIEDNFQQQRKPSLGSIKIQQPPSLDPSPETESPNNIRNIKSKNDQFLPEIPKPQPPATTLVDFGNLPFRRTDSAKQLEDRSENESTSLLELTPGLQIPEFFHNGVDYFRLFKYLHNLQHGGKHNQHLF